MKNPEAPIEGVIINPLIVFEGKHFRDENIARVGEKNFEGRYGLEEKLAHELFLSLDNLRLSLIDFNGKKVLDVGSGEGNLKSFIQKVAKPKTYINVDLENNPKNNLDVQANAVALPFGDESFDLIIANNSVPIIMQSQDFWNPNTFKHDVYAVLDEIIRVMAKGGEARIYPFDLFVPEITKQGTVLIETDDNDITGWGRVLEDILFSISQKYPSIKYSMVEIVEKVRFDQKDLIGDEPEEVITETHLFKIRKI